MLVLFFDFKCRGTTNNWIGLNSWNDLISTTSAKNHRELPRKESLLSLRFESWWSTYAGSGPCDCKGLKHLLERGRPKKFLLHFNSEHTIVGTTNDWTAPSISSMKYAQRAIINRFMILFRKTISSLLPERWTDYPHCARELILRENGQGIIFWMHVQK